ncbi:zinc transporter ZIP11 [Ischnura elegans]|uniref:zinc transporter ZIP11 n=1 Tax=Ischnura elegans TaxID=197161 RepID=UPI001ED899BD|nr:zinc transporter ZIP11 [Ischnura elegans]
MIQGYGPVTQALLGTLLTWGLTAAGAGMVVVIRGSHRKLLDWSLGFAGGVMLAASYWSLLAPAIEAAEMQSGTEGGLAFVPAAIGFVAGALFLQLADSIMEASSLGGDKHQTPGILLALQMSGKTVKNDLDYYQANNPVEKSDSTSIDGFPVSSGVSSYGSGTRRRAGGGAQAGNADVVEGGMAFAGSQGDTKALQWRRILLLVVAITVHNIPEGLAVGVGFGAVGKSPSATFESARNLAIGIGIQNFPEGLAVSLPLQAAGFSPWRSFCLGQLSGMVEPVFGVLGAAAVSIAEPLLPYALAFAAGAMVFVVVDDIVPEANSSGNGRLATWGSVVGFVLMMALDVGLG